MRDVNPKGWLGNPKKGPPRGHASAGHDRKGGWLFGKKRTELTVKHARLVACAAALALGGGLCTIATAASAASAASAAAANTAPIHRLQVGNGDEDWLYDTNHGVWIDAPDKNGDKVPFSSTPETWFQLRKTRTYTTNGTATYQLASNGSSHHCLQDEGGPVEVQECAATSGQYWYFTPDTTGYYIIGNYYWTVKEGGAWMYDKGNYLYTLNSTTFDKFSVDAN
jgi:hypothetical protein